MTTPGLFCGGHGSLFCVLFLFFQSINSCPHIFFDFSLFFKYYLLAKTLGLVILGLPNCICAHIAVLF